MKEHLVIYESDIDRPQWVVVRHKFRIVAMRRAHSILKYRLGSDRFGLYSFTLAVSR